MIKIIIAATVSMMVVGCSGQATDNSMITDDPATSKYNAPSIGLGTFSFRNDWDVDGKAAYTSCARSAGVKGDVPLTVKDYGVATTFTLNSAANVSDVQKARAIGCMNKFAAANSN